MVSATLTSE